MKFALLIGNNEYNDQKLAQLKTPEADVRALARVLKSKKIGNFDEVTLIVNQTESKSRRAISAFLAKKKPDDLMLLYFSGHGVLDDQGLLYLALKDTQLDLLTGTSLPSSFVANEMDRCRSKRQILILDCCHSGAFARGAKGQQRAITETTFEGNGFGRVILTASDSTQYALEGDQVIKQSELSLFTHFLLEGLKTGEADKNNDGKVSLDEWYDYCYSKVIGITPQQVPHKWSYNQQGDLVIAQNPFRRKGDFAIISAPLRAMLDQKQLDYQKHGLLLTAKELAIVADELEKTGFALTDADKQLLLFSALAGGQPQRWLELSGGKALEWLRQACLDESCPQEVRWGAAAQLGKMEDQQTVDLLLSCSQQELDPAKLGAYIDFLTAYLNNSEQPHHLPWMVRRTVFPRLARLRIKEAAAERARMSRVAAYMALPCALITGLVSGTGSPIAIFLTAAALMLIGMMFAIIFAQVVVSLALISLRWSSFWQIVALLGAGLCIGAFLFFCIAGQFQAGVVGGIIALTQLSFYRSKIKIPAAILIVLATLATLIWVMFVSNKYDWLLKTSYTFSASLFVCIYLYAASKQELITLSDLYTG